MNELNEILNKNDLPDKNLRETLFKYLSYWHLFLIAAILSIASSYLYIRYSEPIYEASNVILIKNNEKGGAGMTETSAFSDLTIFDQGVTIENEKSILRSRNLIKSVILDLGFRSEYFALGNIFGFQKSKLYKNSPIEIEYKYVDSLGFIDYTDKFIIKVKNQNFVNIENQDGDFLKEVPLNKWFQQKKDVWMKIKTTNKFSDGVIGRKYEYNFRSLESAISKFYGGTKVEQEGNNTTILRISFTSNSKQKAVDFLNKLVENYNKDCIVDKTIIAQNTSNFIQKRMIVLSQELDTIEEDIKGYKKSNKLVDLENEMEASLSYSKDVRGKYIDASTQMELSEMMLDHLRINNKIEDLIPSNLGITDNRIESSISEHNKLVIERNKELKTTTEKNPKIENLTKNIIELKTSIKSSIENLIQSKKS
ncbi:MAG: hypothetical protein FJZ67_06650 [Bacteroidetes bacterium]|nr:hypothetical protein [Bacteroidota bacterium]